MKKIVIIILMVIAVNVHTKTASADFMDWFGGGSDDNSAEGAGLDYTDPNGVGDDTSQGGAGWDDTNTYGGGDYTSQSGAGWDNTNQNGVGWNNTTQLGVGDDTPNDYNPNVNPNAYGQQSTPGGTPFNSGSNRNPFSSSRDGVPKLSIMGLVSWLVGLMNQLVYVIIGAALVCFLYGILKLSFIEGQKPEAREQARKFMFWGIVSLFVMMSVWGLVKILQFSLFGSSPLTIPKLK